MDGSLALTAAELRAIADAVEGLVQVRGRVDEVTVGEHRVSLEWHDDPRDGAWYTVTAIERVGRTVTRTGQA